MGGLAGSGALAARLGGVYILPMKLANQASLTIIPTRPFHFDATFHKPDHFPSCDSAWEPGTSWQTCRFLGKGVGLRFKGKAGGVRLCVYAARPLSRSFVRFLAEEMRHRFNLDLSLGPFYRAARKDPRLKGAAERLRGMRPGHPHSLYEYLIIGTVLQNAPVRRSVRMLEALLKRFGRRLEFDGKRLWAFWAPGAFRGVSEGDLRKLSLGYRAKAIKRIDEEFRQKNVDELTLRTASFEEQRNKLLRLYGVGPATAWYILFDVFHQYDFFDHISPWEQKIYSRLLFGRPPDAPAPVTKLLKYIQCYGEFRQLAVHYLWEDLWWRFRRGEAEWLRALIRA